MKKFFQIIGFITLMAFSFIYTEKTTTIVKNLDDLMIQIKEDMDNYKIDSIDAIIEDDYIIPGKMGREVDIEKSYDMIKKVGKYSPNLLVYKNIKPKISIKGIYDKYIISGNPNKKEVSLIFKVKQNTNIKKIEKILKENNINATFFIDGTWFEKNNDYILTLTNEGFNIGNMGYNMDYSNHTFSFMNTIINAIGKQKNNYCYVEEDNDITINNCSLYRSYTIKPSIIVKTNPLITIKKEITNGSIISFNINSKVEEELPLIIKYIESKGYNIINLESLIEE